QHADQDPADDPPIGQGDDQHEAEEAEDRRPLPEVAESHQRRRTHDHYLRLFERNDAEEKSDAGGIASLRIFEIALMTYSRNRKIEIRRNNTPSRTRRQAPAATYPYRPQRP